MAGAAAVEDSLAVPRKAKHRVAVGPSESAPHIDPKELEQRLEQILAHPCAQRHSSQKPKGGNNPNVHRQTHGETKCGPATQRKSIRPPQNKESSSTCYGVD